MMSIAIEDLAGHRIVIRCDNRLGDLWLSVRGRQIHSASGHDAGRETGGAAQHRSPADFPSGHRVLDAIIFAHDDLH